MNLPVAVELVRQMNYSGGIALLRKAHFMGVFALKVVVPNVKEIVIVQQDPMEIVLLF